MVDYVRHQTPHTKNVAIGKSAWRGGMGEVVTSRAFRVFLVAM